ncbi:uncharacterized protein SCHCODRAFT_02631635 [Schizophyllum commune H4-8]|uniref:uncharacterized protein n=1 Tax=Schizophyllum commune (strain H4-8 / FGSC 9210) TaxID=578458 RepID=UPI00215FD105|nr:uncharacterized protein SCHCODRAFT_02631635 [Schizophyllum commune H4-8]KAI5890363.1 hypothetical protein SCHCODRAFT_02631635 [Schizophyllum commune H4-8]
MYCRGILLASFLVTVSLVAQAAPIAQPPLPNPISGLEMEARGPISPEDIALAPARNAACKGDCTELSDVDVREPTPCKGDCL